MTNACVLMHVLQACQRTEACKGALRHQLNRIVLQCPESAHMQVHMLRTLTDTGMQTSRLP